MGKECMARLSRRLWGGTSLKMAAKEAKEEVDSRDLTRGRKELANHWRHESLLFALLDEKI